MTDTQFETTVPNSLRHRVLKVGGVAAGVLMLATVGFTGSHILTRQDSGSICPAVGLAGATAATPDLALSEVLNQSQVSDWHRLSSGDAWIVYAPVHSERIDDWKQVTVVRDYDGWHPDSACAS